MKTLFNYYVIGLLCIGILFSGGSVESSDDTSDTYVLDFSGETQEEKAFLKKLRQDERKIDLAIKNTRALIERSKNKPYLPELYLRVADLYVEKSRVTFFIRKAEKKQPLTKLEALPANALKNQAIEVYQRILDHFPDFDQTDKVHFFMAHEFRELGKIHDMIVHYRAIIQSYPHSQYVPESYLLLGDHYFKSQDLDIAQTHYSEIINYPDSPAFSIAQYKLGWCHINRAEFQKAIKRFETALASAENQQTTDIDTYRRVDIRMEALIDMAYCYVDCYKDYPPETALSYFQSFSWSLPSFIASLEKLGKRYFIKKNWHHSAVIYRKLSELQEDAETLLTYAQSIFECVREMNAYDQAAFDVKIIVKALEKQRYTTHIPETEKQEKEKEYEVFAREMITRLHDTARSKKIPKAFEQASEAYIVYLKFFQKSPVFWDMTANCAESLFASENFFEAGQYYERLYQEGTGDMDKKNVLFSAMTAYYHALKSKDQLNAYEKNYCRQGLLSTGNIYVAQYPDAAEIQDVRFNIAWIAYDEGHYDTAIVEFKSFIDAYPNGNAARAAIHLVLDAFYMKEDFKALATFGKSVMTNPSITNETLKSEVAGIVASAEQKLVYSLSLSAIDDWEKGRSQMLSMAQKNTDSTLGEKALLALLGPALENKDLHTLFQAGNTLIESYPNSDHHEKTLILLIQTAMTMGHYQLLAHYLKIFCVAFPEHKDTLLFLEQASQIYQRLGDASTENDLNQQLFQQYSHQASEKIDPFVFQWTDHLITQNKKAEALLIFKKALPQMSKAGQSVATVKMASIYDQLNQTDLAQKLHKKLLPLLKTTKDQVLLDALLEMVFYHVSRTYDTYMNCQLSDHLDEKIFQQKQALFSSLQKEYTDMLAYPSPHWVLAACAHLYQLYHEFARFLRQAPTPDMGESEQKQYLVLIEKKAQSYDTTAKRFQKTFLDRSQTWAMCTTQLLPLFQMIQEDTKTTQTAFSQKPIPTKTLDIMPSTELIPMYQKRMDLPEALTPVFMLAKAYMVREEWGQVYLLCDNGLAVDHLSKKNRSTLLTIQGLASLYQRHDQTAQSLFENALNTDPMNIDARINLVGLLWHYGYQSKAKEILANKETDFSANFLWIHPKARRLSQIAIKSL
ncbi:MAG: tetratricopeptide repeat protein [Candidatus Magnetomorum sp.]|nr:tetratricopeptide repeat protein [Candidatus Magnetomorum sp.]